jgi:hypothetical protein
MGHSFIDTMRCSLACALCLGMAVAISATRYSIDDAFAPCNAKLSGGITDGEITRVTLDGHIQGPLIQELEAHFAKDNPRYEFRITTEFSDCNTCHNGVCTIVGCASMHKATLHMRGSGSVICSPFVREWTLTEMRERWHRTLTHSWEHHANWPFEQPAAEGDRPRVLEDEENEYVTY